MSADSIPTRDQEEGGSASAESRLEDSGAPVVSEDRNVADDGVVTDALVPFARY